MTRKLTRRQQTATAWPCCCDSFKRVKKIYGKCDNVLLQFPGAIEQVGQRQMTDGTWQVSVAVGYHPLQVGHFTRIIRHWRRYCCNNTQSPVSPYLPLYETIYNTVHIYITRTIISELVWINNRTKDVDVYSTQNITMLTCPQLMQFFPAGWGSPQMAASVRMKLVS